MSDRSRPAACAAIVFALILLFPACGTGPYPTAGPSASVGAATGGPGPAAGRPPAANAPPAPSGDPTLALDPEERAFVAVINDYRTQNNLGPLKVSIALTRSSKWMSEDMAAKNYFSHTDSLGRDPFTRMAAMGYGQSGYSGENIAAGNASAQDTFAQWKGSPGHNANMLGANYKAMGVGRAYSASSSYGWYWTTDFGSVVDATL